LHYNHKGVSQQTVDPPDYRRLYLCYVDQLAGRAVCGIEGIPRYKHERTNVTCGNAYCCLNNMENDGGCSNNSVASLDTWNPVGHCQGSSDRFCCGQIFPHEYICEP